MTGSVEFVDDAPASGTGPPHRPPRRRRMAVIAAVALAVAGLGVARAVSGRDHGTPKTTPSPTAASSVELPVGGLLDQLLSTASGRALLSYCVGSADLPTPYAASAQVTVTVAAPGGGSTIDLAPVREDPACRHPLSRCPDRVCDSTDRTSRAVYDAVASRYPRAALATADTVTRTDSTLWYRLLVFRLDGDRLLRVDVARHRGDRATTATDTRSPYLRVVVRRAALDVVVTVTGTVTATDVRTARRVAGDVALTAR